MQNATLVQIQDVLSSKEGCIPPGDPRLWGCLHPSLREVRCHPSTGIYVATSSRIPLPTEGFFAFWLGFPGLHQVRLRSSFDALVLQIRSRGLEADPLETLLREQLAQEGFGEGFSIWVTQQYEFPNIVGLSVALNRILSLGVASGLFHPEQQEARVLLPGEALEWSRPKENHTGDVVSLFEKAYLQGYSSSLRRDYRIQESRPREEIQLRSLRDPLKTLLQSPSVADSTRAQEGFRAPLSFVASLPSQPAADVQVEALVDEIERVASFYDRSVGAVVFRGPESPLRTLEAFTPLPLNQKTLSQAPTPNHKLYLIGPWDSRNALMERRVEFWTRYQTLDALRWGELVDGEQDLVLALMRVVSRESGWSLESSEFLELLRSNSGRCLSQRAWFFWSLENETALRAAAERAQIPILYLGKGTPTGLLDFVVSGVSKGQSLPLSRFQTELHDVQDATWSYPEVKAPTYGFDKAAIYPDQYLLKVTARTDLQKQWASRSQTLLTGERIRSVTSRRREAASVNYFRWTDGKTTWIESLGAKEGWSQVDPKAAGQCAVDVALRGVLAIGGQLSGGTASLWVNQPATDRDSLGLEESSRAWAAYVLALEGACQALTALNFEVTCMNAVGSVFPNSTQEIKVRLRSPVLSPHMGPTLPGFRMTGEVLFAIGPRPAFIDVGSRLLPFVRVVSNHTMKLNAATQLEIYRMIQELMLQGKVTCIRPIGEGGIVEALGEMALWGGMGAQIRPNLPVIELFSGAPGRFVVGILPQEARAVERMVKSEWLTPLGTTGGEKLLGLPLNQLFESRWEQGVPF